MASGVRVVGAPEPGVAARLSAAGLAAYGLLALPVAMAALPLYVHLPKVYGSDLGMPLAIMGAVLLATRLLDALSDPLLGWWSDRGVHRARFIAAGLPLLALGMLGLFHPPAGMQAAPAGQLAAWLAGMLVLVYLGFSMVSISYQAWGAQLSDDTHERTRITATREAFTLVGVLLAAALPSLMGGETLAGMGAFSIGFAALVAICGAVTLLYSPRPLVSQLAAMAAPEAGAPAAAVPGPFEALASALRNPAFVRLLAVFLLSGIAGAIPSTLVLFFIDDVLGQAANAGGFLGLYFLAGAAGMPLWVWLARRIGKAQAWLVSMGVSVAAFCWAFLLGQGDGAAFAVVCAMSGLALGADLALPPSMLADVIDRGRAARLVAAGEGSYFGLWNLVTKANLALAAGIALPVLAWLGYRPGEGGDTAALSLTYCLLPCAFKLAAGVLLWWRPPLEVSMGASR